jgi:hypothetical protein
VTAAGEGGIIVVGVVSIVAGLIGIFGTRAWTRRRAAIVQDEAHGFWLLGIVAVLPAWLVVFVYLLPSGPGMRTHPAGAAAWLCSVALGLVGAIASEARLRHGRSSALGRAPDRAWSLGLWAMIPAWLAMLLGLLAIFVTT